MEIIATKHFIKSAKPLAKKYRSFINVPLKSKRVL